MFVIVTYDISEQKQLNKVRKLLKKYLIWSQNSVFEGEITPGKLHKCMSELEKYIDKTDDSVYVYEVKNPKHITKSVFGLEKNFDDMFL